jgi:hypothetical protein
MASQERLKAAAAHKHAHAVAAVATLQPTHTTANRRSISGSVKHPNSNIFRRSKSCDNQQQKKRNPVPWMTKPPRTKHTHPISVPKLTHVMKPKDTRPLHLRGMRTKSTGNYHEGNQTDHKEMSVTAANALLLPATLCRSGPTALPTLRGTASQTNSPRHSVRAASSLRTQPNNPPTSSKCSIRSARPASGVRSDPRHEPEAVAHPHITTEDLCGARFVSALCALLI